MTRVEISPTESGIVFVNKLLSKFKYFNEDMVDKVDGIIPLIEFEDRYNPIKAVRNPKESGIVPLNPLLFRTKYCRDVSVPKELGRVPVKSNKLGKPISVTMPL